MAIFRLTAKNFAALDAALREQASQFGTKPFEEQSRVIARAVIVEGESPSEVARTYGVTRQRVSQIVTRYYHALLSTDPAAEDVVLWLKHGFELPRSIIEPLEQFLTAARRSKDTKKVQLALGTLIKTLGTQRSKLE